MKRMIRLACLALALPALTPVATAADAPAAAAPAPAGARPNAPTRAALETLLGALPAGLHEGAPRLRTTAQRGETLDAVIRRTMGDSPFKDTFLRGVFLEINAAAFQPGTTRLIAGAPLQVPNLEDLRDHLQRVLGPQHRPAAAAAAASAPADKRHWVRFP